MAAGDHARRPIQCHAHDLAHALGAVQLPVRLCARAAQAAALWQHPSRRLPRGVRAGLSEREAAGTGTRLGTTSPLAAMKIAAVARRSPASDCACTVRLDYVRVRCHIPCRHLLILVAFSYNSTLGAVAVGRTQLLYRRKKSSSQSTKYFKPRTVGTEPPPSSFVNPSRAQGSRRRQRQTCGRTAARLKIRPMHLWCVETHTGTTTWRRPNRPPLQPATQPSRRPGRRYGSARRVPAARVPAGHNLALQAWIPGESSPWNSLLNLALLILNLALLPCYR